MRISDWSSDVCSSDLLWRAHILHPMPFPQPVRPAKGRQPAFGGNPGAGQDHDIANVVHLSFPSRCAIRGPPKSLCHPFPIARTDSKRMTRAIHSGIRHRSEEHTSELQSLMRISYAVVCLKKKITDHHA